MTSTIITFFYFGDLNVYGETHKGCAHSLVAWQSHNTNTSHHTTRQNNYKHNIYMDD